VIGVGGSNGVGATGYVVAMMELMEQLLLKKQSVDHVVFGSSSGGTQAGLVVGADQSDPNAEFQFCLVLFTKGNTEQGAATSRADPRAS